MMLFSILKCLSILFWEGKKRVKTKSDSLLSAGRLLWRAQTGCGRGNIDNLVHMAWNLPFCCGVPLVLCTTGCRYMQTSPAALGVKSHHIWKMKTDGEHDSAHSACAGGHRRSSLLALQQTLGGLPHESARGAPYDRDHLGTIGSHLSTAGFGEVTAPQPVTLLLLPLPPGEAASPYT